MALNRRRSSKDEGPDPQEYVGKADTTESTEQLADAVAQSEGDAVETVEIEGGDVVAGVPEVNNTTPPSAPPGALAPNATPPPDVPRELIEENERIAGIRQQVAQRIVDDGLQIEELSTTEPIFGVGRNAESGERTRYEYNDGEVTTGG